MKINQALRDGKTKAITSVMVGSDCVYAEEALEYLVLILQGDSDSGIAHSKATCSLVEPGLDPYGATFRCIANCVIDENHQDPLKHGLMSSQRHNLRLRSVFNTDLTCACARARPLKHRFNRFA